MNTREIISSFRQGGTGNCVSIAVIKAALETFGLYKVFHAELHADQSHTIRMRDGFEISLTAIELQQAILGSRFIHLNNASVFEYANLCFAAMSKRAQVEQNDDYGPITFDQAIATLNNGEFYTEGPTWLGLRHHVRTIGRKYIFHYPGVVGASKKHCFFASYGIEDVYGSAERIHNLEHRFCKWFRLTPDQIY